MTFSTGYLNSKLYGGILNISTKINYPLNNKYQIALLYRLGISTETGYGSVEYRPDYISELKNEMYSYNELSPLFIYKILYEDTYFYFGSGISVIWGVKQDKTEKFSELGLPMMAGFNINFSKNILGGFELLSIITSKSTFFGGGVNISFRL
jgi:hypothetical protein